MKRGFLSTLCTLTLCLALLLCACGEGDSPATPQGEALQWEQQEGADETQFWTRWGSSQLPYDEEAFLAAADRETLTDPESLRMKEVVNITVEKATVEGKARVRVADGRAQGLMMAPDGDTLIAKNFTGLWVVTPQGSWEEADYCDPNCLLTPDGSGLIYGSGKSTRETRYWQIYWCDLNRKETVQLTGNEAVSYELCGFMGPEAVLCRRVDREAPYQVKLAVVTRAGEETLLDLEASSNCCVQARNGYLLYADDPVDGDLTVYRWAGGTELTEVCTLPAGESWSLWEDDAFNPSGTRLACYAGGQIQLVELRTGEVRTLAMPQWEKELGRVSVSWRDDETLFVGLESKPENDILSWSAWTGVVPS